MTPETVPPVWAYQVGLVVVILFIVGYLVVIDRCEDHPWTFADMLMTFKDGKPIADRQAFMLVGGWCVLSVWGTYWVFTSKSLPEWFVVAYAAYCVGSYGYSRHLKSKSGKNAGTLK